MKRLLQQLAACGDIGWLSLNFAEFIAARSQSGIDDTLCLSAGLLCEASQQGSVCIDLAELGGKPMFTSKSIDPAQIPPAPATPDWCDLLRESDCVGGPGMRAPLILDGERLYLHRFWHYEDYVAGRIRRLAETRVERGQRMEGSRLESILAGDHGIDEDQKRALGVATEKAFCVISGGPGSGKTSTVVRILSLLLSLQPDYRIALAAPTGKAAARMMASIRERFGADAALDAAIPAEAATIHRLLRYRRQGFTYGENHRLPLDCVIVDEASMVDLRLMYHLLAALPDHARLILLGDRDQLASVAAGNVLGDITGHGQELAAGAPGITSSIALLGSNYRFGEDTAIGELAALVNGGQSDSALELLRRNQRGLRWFDEASGRLDSSALAVLYDAYQPIFNSATPAEALDCYESTRILCATNQGPLGVNALNQRISAALLSRNGLPAADYYHGLPIMIERNHHALELYNGDTGLLWDRGSGLRACFRDNSGGIRDFALNRLPGFVPAWASTVHKSQGSEFDSVLLILPADTDSETLCRELLYTAITRARREFILHGAAATARRAIGRLTRRFSGLAQRLGWPG